MVGQVGYGGQVVRYDPWRRLAYAYLTNGMKAGIRAPSTFLRLERALYTAIGVIK